MIIILAYANIAMNSDHKNQNRKSVFLVGQMRGPVTAAPYFATQNKGSASVPPLLIFFKNMHLSKKSDGINPSPLVGEGAEGG